MFFHLRQEMYAPTGNPPTSGNLLFYLALFPLPLPVLHNTRRHQPQLPILHRSFGQYPQPLFLSVASYLTFQNNPMRVFLRKIQVTSKPNCYEKNSAPYMCPDADIFPAGANVPLVTLCSSIRPVLIIFCLIIQAAGKCLSASPLQRVFREILSVCRGWLHYILLPAT